MPEPQKQLIIQKRLQADPLLDRVPEMGIEGRIATIENDRLLPALKNYSQARCGLPAGAPD